jgi:hypothetical protein
MKPIEQLAKDTGIPKAQIERWLKMRGIPAHIPPHILDKVAQIKGDKIREAAGRVA